MPRLVGINHVAVEVGDIDAALAFFGRVFGEVTLRAAARDGLHRHRRPVPGALDRPHAAARPGPPHRARRRRPRGGARAARAAGAELLGDNDFRDPWGNHFQVVDYRDVQFTKTERILAGMGIDGLEKSERALGELRAKGLAD